MLRQWAVNLVRERVTEDSRILKTWANKEIKQVREMFKVPGIIGTTGTSATTTAALASGASAAEEVAGPSYVRGKK